MISPLRHLLPTFVSLLLTFSLMASGPLPTPQTSPSAKCFQTISAIVSKPEDTITAMSEGRPDIRNLFPQSAGVRERYTVERHTKAVLETLEKQIPVSHLETISLPPDFRLIPTLRTTLALHDIGKPLAVKQGNLSLQHVYTLPILETRMRELGHTAAEIRLGKTLVDNDILGALTQGNLRPEDALADIDRLAKENKLKVSDFLKLQSLFYACDASSYPVLLAYVFKTQAGENSPTVDKPLVPATKLFAELEELARWRDSGNELEIKKYISGQDDLRRKASDLNGKISIESRAPWSPDHFTDPKKHDPHHFLYLVHAGRDPRMVGRYLDEVPFASNRMVSLSLLSEKHTNAWSYMGLLIKASQKNIFAAHDTDMFSKDGPEPSQDKVNSFLETAYSNYGLPSPNEVLAKSRKYPGNGIAYHNEALAVGTASTGEKLEVTGVFIRTDSLGSPIIPKEDYDQVKLAAERHKLPLIPIGPSEGYLTVKVRTVDIPETDWLAKIRGAGRRAEIYCSENEWATLKKKSKEEGKPIVAVGEMNLWPAGYGIIYDKGIDFHPAEDLLEANKPGTPAEWSPPISYTFIGR